MYLCGLLVIATVLTTIKAEVDCRKRPPHININSCCKLSNVFSEEVKEKCALWKNKTENVEPDDDHTRGPPDNQRGPMGPHGGRLKHDPLRHLGCFLSCVVNKTEILIDDELQEDNLVSYLNDIFGDDEKVEFLSDKFMFCNKKVKELQSKHPKLKNTPTFCPTKENGILMLCVHLEAFKDCPDSSWSNTDDCNETRDHIKQCFRSNEKKNIEVEEEGSEDT